MTKPRILIVYTGGTIGMRTSDQGYQPVDGFADLLARRLEGRTLTPLPDYDLIEFETLIDSANVHPSDWRKIADTIIEHHEKYDGFVILHGTDTMAYTASALSFMLLGLNKPVIVTGAQIPLIELRNDAFSNVVTSLILAADYDIPEVCLYFNGRIMRGNRTRKLKSTGFDAFDSPNFPWLGTVGINVDLNKNLIHRRKTPDFHTKAFEPNAVSMLQLYPGMDGRMFRGMLDSEDLKALIILSYGVGNPPSTNKSLIDFLSDASDKGIVVVNSSQCIQGAVHQGAYATGDVFNKIGVVPGVDLTLEAAFTKLHFLISRGCRADKIRRELLVPYCGECNRS
ncbi:asparaginase [Terasakiella sp. A23]|uniref:asparaginase n=1 Tax=Terasakiella sp. FCG-A23 TaxID=3080561 RepID=UPI002955080E|nr:asparaginase [Terasakiella sp. A23]MDV7340248.1 asparaginase [Terasakiella sp. A23]